MDKNLQPLILMTGFMIVLFGTQIWTAKKKNAKQKAMLDNLKVGDKIVTIGGITGTIAAVLTDTVEIKIDKTAKITVLKTAVSRVTE
ncbi:MAG: preprotein translocase subunit YajC [Leptotrichiaceae bacterium]|nr:preprotein translocase subunit YajC [Leptotrichiaceae bacterium]